MPTPVHKRALERAIEICGSVDELARALGLNPQAVALWRQPSVPIPGDVFLKLVDLYVDWSTRDVLDRLPRHSHQSNTDLNG
jgi:hypothetical protein